MKWIHKLSEHPTGDYYFSGNIYPSSSVKSRLSNEEIDDIITEIREMVALSVKKHNKGIDYLQVFSRGDDKIFVIDQLSKYQLDQLSDSDRDQYNYFTIIFSNEY